MFISAVAFPFPAFSKNTIARARACGDNVLSSERSGRAIKMLSCSFAYGEPMQTNSAHLDRRLSALARAAPLDSCQIACAVIFALALCARGRNWASIQWVYVLIKMLNRDNRDERTCARARVLREEAPRNQALPFGRRCRKHPREIASLSRQLAAGEWRGREGREKKIRYAAYVLRLNIRRRR